MDTTSEQATSMQPKSRSFLSMPVAIVLAGILISGAILYSQGDLPFVMNEKKLQESMYGKYVALAKEVGLDQKKFNACMEKADDSEIKKDIEDGLTAGVTGTPGFVIGKVQGNGLVESIFIPGAYQEKLFSLILDTYLQDNVAELEKRFLEVVNVQIKDEASKVKSLADLKIKTNIAVSFDDDAVLGNKDAKIAIVEFSDYECPVCQDYFKGTYRVIKQKYIDNGSVKLVFRDFPLSFHEPKATEAARAVNCAKEQKGDEGYYSYHDAYFTNTKSNGQGL